MKKLTGRFPSTSGLCDCRFYIYTPEKPKAAVMLSHGMCEYIERYKEFAEFLCESDIALCGCDHIGHGNSLSEDGTLGYFGHQNGHRRMAQDLHRMKTVMERVFHDIPHFLIGHSMGSFIARIYFARYGDDRWNGAIFMGTAGPFPGAEAIHVHLCKMVIRHGEMWQYKKGEQFALGVFNLRTENYRTPSDWLTRDDKVVDKFRADPKCAFTFTVAGYRDLVSALILANSKCVINNTRRDVPILFLSGGMDPVGEYGFGVRRACSMYLAVGCDANIRIYREARHELLNELNRDEVMSDILDYLIKRI